MRLTKKAVGSWLGSFPGRRVSLLHSGQGKGWLAHQLSEQACGCIPYSSSDSMAGSLALGSDSDRLDM